MNKGYCQDFGTLCFKINMLQGMEWHCFLLSQRKDKLT